MSTSSKGLWGVFITTAGNLLEYAVGVVTSIIVARSLMPDRFGVVSQAVWIAGLLITACSHGTSTTAIVFVAESSGSGEAALGRRIWRHLNFISHVSTIVILIAFAVAVVKVLPDAWASSPAFFVGMIALAAYSKTRSTALTGLALAHHLFTIAAAASAMASVTYLGGSLIVALTSPTIEGFVIAYTASAVAAYLLIAAYMRKNGHVGSGPSLDTDLRRRVNRHLGLTAMLVAVAMASNRVIESFLLSITSSAADFGYFAIAIALTRGAVEIMISGLHVTLMPMMAHAKASRGAHALMGMLNTAMKCYLAAGLLVAGAGAFAVTPVVMVLYGSSYSPAIHVTQIVMVGAGIGLISAAIGAFQSVTERQDLRVWLAGASLAVNLVLALALVPTFGVTGAAFSFAITRLVSALMSLAVVSRVSDQRVEMLPLLRLLLAAAAAVAPSFAIYAAYGNVWAGAIAACVFSVVFLIGSLVFRCWKHSDLEELAAIARRMPICADTSARALSRIARMFGARSKDEPQ